MEIYNRLYANSDASQLQAKVDEIMRRFDTINSNTSYQNGGDIVSSFLGGAQQEQARQNAISALKLSTEAATVQNELKYATEKIFNECDVLGYQDYLKKQNEQNQIIHDIYFPKETNKDNLSTYSNETTVFLPSKFIFKI
jgi:hypothetical protein